MKENRKSDLGSRFPFALSFDSRAFIQGLSDDIMILSLYLLSFHLLSDELICKSYSHWKWKKKARDPGYVFGDGFCSVVKEKCFDEEVKFLVSAWLLCLLLVFPFLFDIPFP